MNAAAMEHDVLLVEDAEPLARIYREYLRNEPYRVTHAATGQAGLDALVRVEPAAIVLDLKLPDMNGLEILKHVRQQEIDSSVIVITANASIDIAVEAMRQGADDFIVKPFNAARLIYTLRNVLERHALKAMVRSFQEDVGRQAFCGFIGGSPPMQAVYRMIENAGPSMSTVFITGESGTGKEVCAEAVHLMSPRREAPFMALNCAAIPRDLMESEIFGHIKGAFTGAVAEREGAAATARGGTLFLDEICEMDPALQAKLLRFVQTGEYQMVGSSETQRADVRLVCATNRDPWVEVEAGRFREDLYYRLHVIPVHLPPLRDRGDDIIAIGLHFLQRFAKEERRAFEGFALDADALLRRHSWPGNVRELQNVIRNVVVLHDGPLVTAEMLSGALVQRGPRRTPVPPADDAALSAGPSPSSAVRLRPLRQVERDYINEALRACDNNVPKAAALLDISPSTIYRRLREDADGG